MRTSSAKMNVAAAITIFVSFGLLLTASSLGVLIIAATAMFTAIGWLLVQILGEFFGSVSQAFLVLAGMWFGDVVWDLFFNTADLDAGSFAMEFAEALALAINLYLYRHQLVRSD